MQNVTRQYSESMKSPLRERGYAIIDVETVDHHAHSVLEKEHIISNKASHKCSDIFSIVKEYEYDYEEYALLDFNNIHIDGSTYFYPSKSNYTFKNTGYISDELSLEDGSFASVGGADIEIKIPFEIGYRFKGLTIDFGDNPPKDFEIYFDGISKSVRNNTLSVWSMDDVIKISSTNIGICILKYPPGQPKRCRIKKIKLGTIVRLNPESIISVKINESISSICAELPQNDFILSLNNIDESYNIENQNGLIRYFNRDNKITVSFGYLISDDVFQTVKGGTYYISEIENNSNTTTIRASSIINLLDEEYTGGLIDLTNPNTTLYEILEGILKDSHVEKYFIDSKFKTIINTIPIPLVSRKEALQIAANAHCCDLRDNKDGVVEIIAKQRGQLINELNTNSAFKNFPASISNNSNYLDDKEFAFLSQDYIRLDGKTLYAPVDLTEKVYGCSFITETCSDDKGDNLAVKLNITLPHTLACNSALQIYYGNGSLPKEIIIIDIISRKPLKIIEAKDIKRITNINLLSIKGIEGNQKLIVISGGTQKPHSRLAIRGIEVSNKTGFELNKKDILKPVEVTKTETVNRIIVPYNTVTKSNEFEELATYMPNYGDSKVQKFVFEESYAEYKLENPSLVGAVEDYYTTISKAHSFTVIYPPGGVPGEIKISGRKSEVKEIGRVDECLIRSGTKVIEWKNPLLSSYEMANEVLQLLATYYKRNTNYYCETRGYPELETLDIIGMDNDYIDDLKTEIYERTFMFENGFNEQIKLKNIK